MRVHVCNGEEKHLYILQSTTYYPDHPNNTPQNIQDLDLWTGNYEVAYLATSLEQARDSAQGYIDSCKGHRHGLGLTWRQYDYYNDSGTSYVWRWWPEGSDVVMPYEKYPAVRWDESPEPERRGEYLNRDVGPLDYMGGVYWLRRVYLVDLPMLLREGEEKVKRWTEEKEKEKDDGNNTSVE